MEKYRLSNAARQLGLSRQRIYKLAQDGILKITREDGYFFITARELERFKKLQRKIGRPQKLLTVEIGGCIVSHGAETDGTGNQIERESGNDSRRSNGQKSVR